MPLEQSSKSEVLIIASSADHEAAKRGLANLVEVLRRKYRVVFLDDIEPGADSVEVMRDRIKTATWRIILLSVDMMADEGLNALLAERPLAQAHDILVQWRSVDYPTSVQAIYGDQSEGMVLPFKPLVKVYREGTEIDETILVQVQHKILTQLGLVKSNAKSADVLDQSNMPFLKDPLFSGRTEEMKQVLLRLGSPGDNKVAVITGLGGIGKTKLAVETAFTFIEQDEKVKYKHIFFIQANDDAAIIDGFSTIAQILDLPCDPTNPRSVAFVVQKELRKRSDYLLVVDNIDDFDLVKKYLPENQSKKPTIFTSRYNLPHFSEHSLHLRELDNNQAALLLLKLVGAPDPETQRSSITVSWKLAQEIAHELGNFPLALRQAGAYVRETHCTLEEYLALYREKRHLLLARRTPTVHQDYNDTVATTWLVSFEAMGKVCPGAIRALKFAAFLDPDNVHEDFLAADPEWTDAFQRSEAMSVAQRFSFMDQTDPNQTHGKNFRMHRLVQEVLRNSMLHADQPIADVKESDIYDRRAAEAVNANFPLVRRFIDLQKALIYYKSARACVEYKRPEPIGATDELSVKIAIFMSQAHLPEAREFHERILPLVESSPALNAKLKAQFFYSFGGLYLYEPQASEAIIIFEKAYAFAKGVDDASLVFEIVERLAHHYALYDGNVDRAKKILTENIALFRQDKTLYSNPGIVRIFCTYASILRGQGHQEEASLIENEAIDVVHGLDEKSKTEDSNRLNSISSIAKFAGYFFIYAKQDLPSTSTVAERSKYDSLRKSLLSSAEGLLKEALYFYEKADNRMSLAYADAVTWLCLIYIDQEKYSETDTLAHETLKMLEPVYGISSRLNLGILIVLGQLHSRLKDYEKAIKFFHKALLIAKTFKLETTVLDLEHDISGAFLLKPFASRRK